ncbi:Outer membrane protein omp85 precursor [Eikenella corrodens]|uniref:Outer membrane protein assembly factor BamA n=2 Tax=Eikenella corrodens TaxID=539 RepID=C0DWL5_EIKCO|nr:outer membrane protein assembly factor BamA [Eikenella corrodens]EEG23568.1 outer membrane protein assembly complex, YaeT protein [Eikenella corrodens ATCC 23834]MDU4299727.1 outer membrane protein assembly factor BamA [Eikenella corrodens]OAM19550.1 outer membrane protein assembly factor BamA [Eikenella corrodens]UAK74794.1 outer membrane protein assembly factor BamA [Eikenella corrodens]SNW08853.1 Outer membrane protein omp85 precursor [Eikenella corrodens]
MKLNKLTFSLFAAGLSSWALAAAPFTIQDIRIEGLQRTDPSTVLGHLPVKVGSTFTDGEGEQIIKNLYATGLFDDVRVETMGNQVLLTVVERPIINTLTVTGGKTLPSDAIKKNLDSFGLGQSQPFNQSILNQAVAGLQQEYANQGKLSATITPEISRLSRNRVDITLKIDEGPTTHIKEIDFEGNQHFSNRTLRRQMQMDRHGMLSWLSKDDRFSDEKFRQDLQSITDFYQNEGFFEGRVQDADVRYNADRTEQTLWIKVHEGERYRWGKVRIEGDTREVPREELEALLKMREGRRYNRSQMVESLQAIQDRMGQAGYALAQVGVQPQPDQANHIVDFVLTVNPGRKYYVNQIHISGNNKTRDAVIRREMRQTEAAPYDSAKLNRSKDRIQLLGYFDDVKVETRPLPDTPDQVDVDVSVKERSTGSVEVAAGWVQDTGLVLSAGVAQDNLFGTGKSANFRIARGKTQNTASLSFTDPYFTPDGVSLGYDIYYRGFMPYKSSSSSSSNNYETTRIGLGARMGVPVTEYDRVNFGLAVEHLNVKLHGDVNYQPYRYRQFLQEHGEKNWILKGNIGWGRNKTDDALWPTRGYTTSVNADLGLPGGDLKYYILTHDQRWFFPLSKSFTLMLGGEVGYAGSYGGTSSVPFFNNFYGGGLGSVRGYESGSLGPKVYEIYGNSRNIVNYGGTYKAYASAELLFPFPGVKDQRSVRLSVFADAGSVWDGKTYNTGAYSSANPYGTNGYYSQDHRSTFSNELRYSVGAALTWLSPLGPMKFSFAHPMRRRDNDQIQRFQFQLGTTF